MLIMLYHADVLHWKFNTEVCNSRRTLTWISQKLMVKEPCFYFLDTLPASNAFLCHQIIKQGCVVSAITESRP